MSEYDSSPHQVGGVCVVVAIVTVDTVVDVVVVIVFCLGSGASRMMRVCCYSGLLSVVSGLN